MDERLRDLFMGMLNREPLALVKLARGYGGFAPSKRAGGVLVRQRWDRGAPVSEVGNQVDVAKNQEAWKEFLHSSASKKSFVDRLSNLVEACRLQKISYLRAHVSPRLGKCAKCERSFLAGDNRKGRRYCSKKCGWNTTAKPATYKRRAAQKEKKLQRAAQAIRSWNGTGDWKDWTASRTGLTRKFLTQAANRSDLKAPA